MKYLKPVCTIFVLALSATVLTPQSFEKPLTNAEIASMLKGGVPESTIALLIGRSAERGAVNFDVSPGALVELSRQGASERVLNAILWAERFGTARKARPEGETDLGLPTSAGVYYQTPNGWTALSLQILWPPILVPTRLAFARGATYAATLPGEHAAFQVAQSRPNFYVREAVSSAWQIVRLTVRKGHREVPLVTGDESIEGGFRPGELRNTQITRVSDSVFTARPVQELQPAEYLLCTTATGAHRLFVCFEFGVQQ